MAPFYGTWQAGARGTARIRTRVAAPIALAFAGPTTMMGVSLRQPLDAGLVDDGDVDQRHVADAGHVVVAQTRVEKAAGVE